ncbi:MAG TPA: tyrosine-type recombinase/integrase [Chitinophagaceae bacterium]|nr:tyrosine-type recombinase/integrase [Chitinophagaceae bacterium]
MEFVPEVRLVELFHRGRRCIGISFEKNVRFNQLLKERTGAKWSSENRCWWLPETDENLRLLRELFGNNLLWPPGVLVSSRQKQLPAARREIHPANRHVLPAMEEHLKLKGYSPATLRTYLNEMRQLLLLIGQVRADDLEPPQLKRYLLYCHERLRLTENTLHSRMNALKFYYEQVLRRAKFFWEIPRPKKQLLLPRLFNQEEVVAILKATSNVKHRLMLMLCYGAGLRVSEVVRLQVCDIDQGRRCIWVKRAKGKKDRVVPLSPLLLVMVREYLKAHHPDPLGYLFPGQGKGLPYSTRSLQLVLAAAKRRARVFKPGSIHALRHSFATHLLDRGTDVTMIMRLLGHNEIRTTLRYLHVTNRDILDVISPLEDLPFGH